MKTIGIDLANVNTIHVFEASGLGKAPYQFLGVSVKVGPLKLSDGSEVGAPGQPMGSCKFCGTGIKYCFDLRSADGKDFYVGCECIKKSGDRGLLKVVSTFEKQKRQAANEKRRQERRAKQIVWAQESHDRCFELLASSEVKEKLNQKPHPCIPGMTLFNYVEFLVDRARSYSRALSIIETEMKGVQS